MERLVEKLSRFISNGVDAETRERLMRVRSISELERIQERIRSFSSGDRVLFYTLSILVGIASLVGLYSLEQTLLQEIPTYGGSLIEGKVGSPQFINPLLTISDADRDLSALVYAGLMGLSGDGSLIPVLAQGYTLSPDGKTYTFALRKDATFTDGTPVTAQDVVFTVRKAQDPGLKSPEYANWSGVSVLAVDQHTVPWTYNAWCSSFTTMAKLVERRDSLLHTRNESSRRGAIQSC